MKILNIISIAFIMLFALGTSASAKIDTHLNLYIAGQTSRSFSIDTLKYNKTTGRELLSFNTFILDSDLSTFDSQSNRMIINLAKNSSSGRIDYERNRGHFSTTVILKTSATPMALYRCDSSKGVWCTIKDEPGFWLKQKSNYLKVLTYAPNATYTNPWWVFEKNSSVYYVLAPVEVATN